MTRDDIIRMAHEAGWSGIYSQWVSPIEREHLTVPVTMGQIERFATLVAAAEREACIKLIEDFSKTTMVPVRDTWVMGLIAGANALRARGQHFMGWRGD